MRLSTFLAALMLAIAAISPARAEEGRSGGKLVLTDGISTVEGAGGGGIASWSLIAGHETDRGIGGTVQATVVPLSDYTLRSYGASLGFFDRLELSYARQDFDTRAAGAKLGLGRGFMFSQDVYGAKLRLVGDAVWNQDRWLPQIAVGVQHKVADQGAVIRAVGGRRASGTDIYVAATKLFLAQGLLLDATVRFTDANQLGLLGFGGERARGRSAQFEGSVAKLLTRKLAIGAEVRTKPDNLGFSHESRALDLFAAWSVRKHVTLSLAYADLGTIATLPHQRGLFAQFRAVL